MKGTLVILMLIILCGISAGANETDDVEQFFNQYVTAANSYDNGYFNYYTDNARIIRVVEKDDGTCQSVNIPLDRYKSEAKRSTKLMKLRKYKNYYSNIRILPHGKDYKIVAMRTPSTSGYKIPAYFIVGKNDKGEWKIKEESMNTKVQAFLKNS